MGEDGELTDKDFGNLIFGRPFMASAGVAIDVPRGEIILRVDDDVSVLKVIHKAYGKPPLTADNYPPLIDESHPSYTIKKDNIDYEYKYWNPNRYSQYIGESGDICSCHIDRPP